MRASSQYVSTAPSTSLPRNLTHLVFDPNRESFVSHAIWCEYEQIVLYDKNWTMGYFSSKLQSGQESSDTVFSEQVWGIAVFDCYCICCAMSTTASAPIYIASDKRSVTAWHYVSQLIQTRGKHHCTEYRHQPASILYKNVWSWEHGVRSCSLPCLTATWPHRTRAPAHCASSGASLFLYLTSCP